MESTEWIDSWLRSFCGNSSGLLLALLLLVLLDYITGICVAIQTKQLSSQIGAKGITKKVAMFVVIAFCHVLDAYLLHAEAALETVSTIFYLSNEGISILENVGKLGVPLPQKVQTLLSYLKKSGDNDPPSSERRRRHGAHSTPNLSHPKRLLPFRRCPHASGADAPLRGLRPARCHGLCPKWEPARGESLCPRLHRRQFTRPSPGPAAAGTAAGPPTTPTSAWKCVNPPPFAIPAGQTS